MRGLRLKGGNYEGRYVIVDVQMDHDYPTIRQTLFDPYCRRGGTVLIRRQPDTIWRIDYQPADGEEAGEATREDMVRHSVAAVLREIGVETGGCPHTAIREDASINLAAVDTMNEKFPGLDVILIESGGDNLAATFSPELADITIYVIDVSAGEKIPRKGGPGITRSDLLVINKTDLAPLVGASLEVMDSDTKRMRGDRPYVFSNMKTKEGLDTIAGFIIAAGGLDADAAKSASS